MLVPIVKKWIAFETERFRIGVATSLADVASFVFTSFYFLVLVQKHRRQKYDRNYIKIHTHVGPHVIDRSADHHFHHHHQQQQQHVFILQEKKTII